MEIRPLVEADWTVLRALREGALADAPDSFGPTLASALEQPESYWRGWARGRPGRMQAWAAFDGETPVGLISGGMPNPAVGHWGALWVAPAARGQGLAAALIAAITGWFEANGCTRIELEVTEGNPAENLYRRLGYVRTGARKPLRDGSSLFEVTMARDIGPKPESV